MTPGAGLSLEQAPTLSAPLRFYLGAPLFAAAGAALLAAEGPYALASRWMPAALAATHLFAVGFLAQVMAGSLLQLLPVVAGAPVPAVRAVATALHLGLLAGAVALPAVFLSRSPAALFVAEAALGAATGVLVLACAAALVRARAGLATAGGIALALASLAVTATLGLLLAPSFAGGRALASELRHLHPAWALGGWVGLLVVSVSLQVVPMFHLTPPYPPAARRYLPPALFLTLVAASLARGLAARALLFALLALEFTLFAALTLHLQRRRRRRAVDASLTLWRLSLASLVLASALAALRPALPAAWAPRVEVLAAVVYLVGFAWSVVTGMLVKIVPFLCWFHLQARFLGRGKVPHLGVFLGEGDARRVGHAHAVVLALLLLALALPALHRLAWGAFAAEALGFGALLTRAAWRHRGTARRLAAALPSPPG